MAGNYRIEDWIVSLTAVFTSAIYIIPPAHTLVTPAKAGVQKAATEARTLDSRLRGNDGVFERSLRELEARRLGGAGDVEGAE